jgi:hypothetical protein
VIKPLHKICLYTKPEEERKEPITTEIKGDILTEECCFA